MKKQHLDPKAVIMESKVRDLGWGNGWKQTPEIVKNCRKLKHRVSDIDHSGMRGTDHEVRCDVCGYVYHYDSS